MAEVNDTRGWIMASVSGIACCVGASIICIDLLVQLFPRGRNWRIQDSNTFLSSSLSLSFGVMLYSALYSMLPSARTYLTEGGMTPSAASFLLIGCFLGGVVGITLVSRFIHHYMPSKVVDCDHKHEDTEHERPSSELEHDEEGAYDAAAYEETPLLSRTDSLKAHSVDPQIPSEDEVPHGSNALPGTQSHPSSLRDPARPTIKPSFTKRMTSFIAGANSLCEQDGPCHGYSSPCGPSCFKDVSSSPTRGTSRRFLGAYRSSLRRAHTSAGDEEVGSTFTRSPGNLRQSNHSTQAHRDRTGYGTDAAGWQPHSHANGDPAVDSKSQDQLESGQHHHHVPTNAFLSIGLQTSIAIALHKLPEGFITYATNHANPTLGFAVFMALFIHNITEGFAMALPLYLAIGSRPKAMLWSSLLGGVSQPAGAGIAALWFRAAQNNNMSPNELVYGAMFAVTAGIMASVALQLFSESLVLTHNKNLCVAFAFVGMGILGISNALTA